METFSALLSLFAGNSPVSGEFPAQRPVMWSFDVSFDLRLIKRLSKHSQGWWFEMLSRPFWRHCKDSSFTNRWVSSMGNIFRNDTLLHLLIKWNCSSNIYSFQSWIVCQLRTAALGLMIASMENIFRNYTLLHLFIGYTTAQVISGYFHHEYSVNLKPLSQQCYIIMIHWIGADQLLILTLLCLSNAILIVLICWSNTIWPCAEIWNHYVSNILVLKDE